jgi:hypothetical protein
VQEPVLVELVRQVVAEKVPAAGEDTTPGFADNWGLLLVERVALQVLGRMMAEYR